MPASFRVFDGSSILLGSVGQEFSLEYIFERRVAAMLNIARVLICVFVLGVLSGCLDINKKITIEADGSGVLQMEVIVPPKFAGHVAPQLKSRKLIAREGVVRKNYFKEKSFYHTETLKFKKLDELVLNGNDISIELFKRWFFSFGSRDAVFKHVMNFSPLSKEQQQASAIFADRFFSLIVTLPGNVKKAYPVALQGVEITPIVSGNTITWQMPLATLLQSRKMVVKIDFEGSFGFSETISSQNALAARK